MLWGLLGCFAVLGAGRSPEGLHQLVSQMASGQPGWLASLDHHVANLLAHRGLGVSVALAMLLAIIAVGVFLPARLAPRHHCPGPGAECRDLGTGRGLRGSLHGFGHRPELGTTADTDRCRLLALSTSVGPARLAAALQRRGCEAMQGPGWLPDSFAGLMIAILDLLRCAAARIAAIASANQRRRQHRSCDHGSGHGGMLVPALTILPTALWEAVLRRSGRLVLVAKRTIRRSAPGGRCGARLHHVSHYLTHLVMSFAMLYMYFAVACQWHDECRSRCPWARHLAPRRTLWGSPCSS